MTIETREMPDRGSGLIGQSLDELIAMSPEVDDFKILCMLEDALESKASSSDLTAAEVYVLAILALDREVVNGGYDQFFTNSSLCYASVILDACEAIEFPEIRECTARAIKAIGSTDPEEIDEVMSQDDAVREEELAACDDSYYEADPIGEFRVQARLFEFVKANRTVIEPRHACDNTNTAARENEELVLTRYREAYGDPPEIGSSKSIGVVVRTMRQIANQLDQI